MAPARGVARASPASSAIRVGESQALGFLVGRRAMDGDLSGAIALALESAAIAREAGWTWWEAGAARRCRVARARAREISTQPRPIRLRGARARRSSSATARLLVFAAAELAIIAAERGDAERAGLLWGAIEARRALGASGQWERERAELEALVLRVDGPAVRAQRAAEGSLAVDRAGCRLEQPRRP